jgi:hypothetical protein
MPFYELIDGFVIVDFLDALTNSYTVLGIAGAGEFAA